MKLRPAQHTARGPHAAAQAFDVASKKFEKCYNLNKVMSRPTVEGSIIG